MNLERKGNTLTNKDRAGYEAARKRNEALEEKRKNDALLNSHTLQIDQLIREIQNINILSQQLEQLKKEISSLKNITKSVDVLSKELNAVKSSIKKMETDLKKGKR